MSRATFSDTRRRELFIGGRGATPHSKETTPVLSAHSGRVIGPAPDADTADVDSSVAAARTAFDAPGGWAHRRPRERAAVLRRFAGLLDGPGPGPGGGGGSEETSGNHGSRDRLALALLLATAAGPSPVACSHRTAGTRRPWRRSRGPCASGRPSIAGPRRDPW
ncbi:aldehyde dehydrogenase family protein [Streptomyces sp. NBC_01317]|uniref:aldehyde dehydrogenase family protein n=1 Tax=Streptomyces sp. NBC_01317 TaxID=2903822 RepID=UPI002E144ADE|nr:aldehyde dehydrogenase family protein [Streptomyces sp. NBC_01317]